MENQRQCSACGLVKGPKSFRSKVCGLCWTCIHRQKLENPNYKAGRKREYERHRPKLLAKAARQRTASFACFMNRCMTNLQLSDRKRGRDCDLTINHLVELLEKQRGRCAISGIPMTHAMHDLQAVSIDRIDSRRGHMQSNIQLVCRFVNLAKGSHLCADLRKAFDLVVEHYRPLIVGDQHPC